MTREQYFNDYLRGLHAALGVANDKPTALAFSVAADIQRLIDVENKRLVPIKARIERDKRAMAPRTY